MFLRIICLSLLLITPVSYADELQDHPLLERYPGFTFMVSRHEDHARYIFPLDVPAGAKSFKKQQVLEGDLTRFAYEQSGGAGALQVIRNYESALKEAGANIDYICIDKECLGVEDYHPTHVFGHHNALIVSHEIQKFALLTASLNQGGDQYWLAIIVGQFKDYTRYELVVMQPATMATDLISVNDISQGLENQGKVALYGIYFDTGKAVIKPGSAPTLDAISQFLKSKTDIHLYVVGHTDYTGSLASNMSLSQLRAEAVVTALSGRGISSNRLVARGVGPLAPVATNKVEKGKKLNRRVELVLSQQHSN